MVRYIIKYLFNKKTLYFIPDTEFFYCNSIYNPKNIFAAKTAQIAATATTTSPLFR